MVQRLACAVVLLVGLVALSVQAGEEKGAISARDLLMAYKDRDNTGAADKMYKGKDLIVTGKVLQVGRSGINSISLTGGTDLKGDVQCDFGPGAYKDIFQPLIKSKQLKAGATVSIQGTCNGILKNTGFKVRLDNCKFVKMD